MNTMDIEKVIAYNFPIISKDYKVFALHKDQCRECPVYNDYKQNVQSEGNAKNPTFLFIGESPGQEETFQNRPFIGAAGQLLRSELRKHSPIFTKKTTLISNILACRPLFNKFPDDAKIINTCTNNWLYKEIKITRPKIIIVLGNHALRQIRHEHSITVARGKWKFVSDFRAWTFATFHPSYVMRSDPDSYIRAFFSQDIQTFATTYGTFCNDERINMNDEDWSKKQTYAKAVELGLLQ